MNLRRRISAGAVATLVITGGLMATSLGVSASVRHPSVSIRTVAPAAAKTHVFNASYSGHISVLWNSSGPTTASITGKGKGTDFGLVTITGSGKVTASGQSDPINGRGVLRGKGEMLVLQFITGSTATAASTSAPTTVVVAGTAKVVGGSGAFARATGTLKVSGAFSIQSTTGTETDTFNATLKGTVRTS